LAAVDAREGLVYNTTWTPHINLIKFHNRPGISFHVAKTIPDLIIVGSIRPMTRNVSWVAFDVGKGNLGSPVNGKGPHKRVKELITSSLPVVDDGHNVDFNVAGTTMPNNGPQYLHDSVLHGWFLAHYLEERKVQGLKFRECQLQAGANYLCFTEDGTALQVIILVPVEVVPQALFEEHVYQLGHSFYEEILVGIIYLLIVVCKICDAPLMNK
jgi:hypothetical protein